MPNNNEIGTISRRLFLMVGFAGLVASQGEPRGPGPILTQIKPVESAGPSLFDRPPTPKTRLGETFNQETFNSMFPIDTLITELKKKATIDFYEYKHGRYGGGSIVSAYRPFWKDFLVYGHAVDRVPNQLDAHFNNMPNDNRLQPGLEYLYMDLQIGDTHIIGRSDHAVDSGKMLPTAMSPDEYAHFLQDKLKELDTFCYVVPLEP